MQVVILAGGLGTRLSEETVNVPKPIVRIGQDPIILHLMKYYASYGHTDFVIALGYKGDVIKEYSSNFGLHRSSIEVNLSTQTTKIVKPLQEDWKIKLIDTGEGTGTGGRLLALRDLLDENFLMTYGDGLSNVDLDELLTATGAELTEMPRNKERSFCCGAGGGRMWMEEKIGERINLNRVDEAIATGAEEVAVGCPFCRVMVSDGMVAKNSSVEVLDVAQIMLRSVKRSG